MISNPNPPLVSVVTPVYNGETTLCECIESVLAQTYPNWNYVIVDNCSTDRTHDIAQEYAVKDARIRVHRNDLGSGDWRELEPGRCDLVVSVLYDKIIGPELIHATPQIINCHPGRLPQYRGVRPSPGAHCVRAALSRKGRG